MKLEDFLVIVFLVGAVCFMPAFGQAESNPTETTVERNLKEAKIPLMTDDDVAQREEQKMSRDGFSVAEKKILEANAEKFTFQAEVNRLMGIIINSLYSNKEIFLRELISNASDALDKIRYVSLTNPDALGEGDTAKLEIKIKADPDAKTLYITDRGVGMTKQDLINNLGTIAQSGTKEFLKKLQDGNDSSSGMNLIGQFGVGFYSCFLVAERVIVTTKHNDDKQYVWESTADNTFTITEDPRGNTLGRGTQIALIMKEDQEDYLQLDTLKGVVKKYSEFINYPIYLWTSHEEEREEPVEEEKKEDVEEKKEDEDKLKVEEEEDKEEEKPKTKKVKHTVWDWTLVNENKPIWTRSAKEVTKEEYESFYKSIAKDTEAPLNYIHFLGEGEVDFKAILFVPQAPPENVFDTRGKDGKTPSLKLYVRRVFITDSLDELLPKYLLFLRGVVDSDDLPLNVSREIFQQNKSLEVIKKKLVRKAIAMFQAMADDTSKEGKEKWEKFYKNFGTALKWGAIEDKLNRTRLSKLMRFVSSKTGELTSLEDYVSRMKEGQKDIYWLAGDSKEVLEKSPLVEKFIKRGYEVLYMVDPIDEYTMASMEKFDGKHKLANVGREGTKLDDDKEEEKEATEQFKKLTDFLSKELAGKVEKTVVSTRLTKTPSALVAGLYGYTAHQEKIVKAQALGSEKAGGFMKARRILEINHKHPIIIELNRRVTENADDQTAKDTAELLFETAALHSGFQLDEPAEFAERIHRMMKLSLNLDPEATVAEEPEVEEKKEEKETEKKEEEEEEETKEEEKKEEEKEEEKKEDEKEEEKVKDEL